MSNKLHHLSKFQSLLPWNLSATLLRNPVVISLDSPVDNTKYFPHATYVSLFKDYAEALQANDYEQLAGITEPSFRRRAVQRMEEFHQGVSGCGGQVRIENNKKRQDETSIYLYNIENYFIIGDSNEQYDRENFTKTTYLAQPNEHFKVTIPTLDPHSNQLLHLEKELSVTQIVNTDTFSQQSTGLLLMRLHFLVTSYMNLYVWDPSLNQAVLGHQSSSGSRINRSLADKQSHIMIVDKPVARIHVGDTFLETEEQIEDRVVQHYEKDEGLQISEFDGYKGVELDIVKKMGQLEVIYFGKGVLRSVIRGVI